MDSKVNYFFRTRRTRLLLSILVIFISFSAGASIRIVDQHFSERGKPSEPPEAPVNQGPKVGDLIDPNSAGRVFPVGSLGKFSLKDSFIVGPSRFENLVTDKSCFQDSRAFEDLDLMVLNATYQFSPDESELDPPEGTITVRLARLPSGTVGSVSTTLASSLPSCKFITQDDFRSGMIGVSVSSRKFNSIQIGGASVAFSEIAVEPELYIPGNGIPASYIDTEKDYVSIFATSKNWYFSILYRNHWDSSLYIFLESFLESLDSTLGTQFKK